MLLRGGKKWDGGPSVTTYSTVSIIITVDKPLMEPTRYYGMAWPYRSRPTRLAMPCRGMDCRWTSIGGHPASPGRGSCGDAWDSTPRTPPPCTQPTLSRGLGCSSCKAHGSLSSLVSSPPPRSIQLASSGGGSFPCHMTSAGPSHY